MPGRIDSLEMKISLLEAELACAQDSADQWREMAIALAEFIQEDHRSTLLTNGQQIDPVAGGEWRSRNG